MGVSPMSPTGVSPVAKCEETAGNTGKMPVLLTGETPVLRVLFGTDEFMLSDEIKKELEAEARHYPQRKAIVAEALKAVQARRGWVDDESLRDVAEFLGMSVDEVDSIATFYSAIFRRPVGRHVIFICDSVSCYLTGYEKLLDYLTTRLGIALGQTTTDGRFTLLPNACLGLCEQAPAMMVDRDTYGHLTPQRIDEILSKYD